VKSGLSIVVSAVAAASVCNTALAGGLLAFGRTRIGDVTYEVASVFDVNHDGAMDIVCGEYWFPGPAFAARHRICKVDRVLDYYDEFSSIPMDVNGDGYLDVIGGGWWGQTLVWRENPKGGTGLWPTHVIDKPGNIETTRCWDVDGDGHDEVVPNAGDNVVVYRLRRDSSGRPAGAFDKIVIKQGGCGHGLGFGDVNGDGRGDFATAQGWIEAPADGLAGTWTAHAEFQLGPASVPILVHDVNEDGRADLIVGMGHDYGLFWYEQGVSAQGARTWTKHVIDPDRSQYHDMMLADIDQDGAVELVTGKRYRAHVGHDPGANDPLGVYYFEMDRGAFRRVTLDYGPPERASGVGLYFWIADVDGNGWLDIVAPGKEGLYLFRNRGPLRLTTR
jgi:hypothetical protein